MARSSKKKSTKKTVGQSGGRSSSERTSQNNRPHNNQPQGIRPPDSSKSSTSDQNRSSTQLSSARQKNLLFQKVAVFIDAENIEMSGLKHHEGRTDYKKILEAIGDREILRILYYKPEYKDISETFAKFLAGVGAEIRRPQKNADSFLIIDAVTMADKIDVAVILGGDKDFLPLIWYLRSRGCRVEIWSWPETTSDELKKGADFYFPITKDYVIT